MDNWYHAHKIRVNWVILYVTLWWQGIHSVWLAVHSCTIVPVPPSGGVIWKTQVIWKYSLRTSVPRFSMHTLEKISQWKMLSKIKIYFKREKEAGGWARYNTVQIWVNLPFPNYKQIRTVSLWQNSENSKSSYNTVQIWVNLPFPNYKQIRTVSLWQNCANLGKPAFSKLQADKDS